MSAYAYHGRGYQARRGRGSGRGRSPSFVSPAPVRVPPSVGKTEVCVVPEPDQVSHDAKSCPNSSTPLVVSEYHGEELFPTLRAAGVVPGEALGRLASVLTTSQLVQHDVPHPHPVLATERLVAEARVIELIRRDGYEGRIVDIGGAPQRHANSKRDVWCLCPKMAPEDYWREYLRENYGRYCEHSLLDLATNACSCAYSPPYAPPSYAMTIQSLYYLKPEEMLMLLKSGYKAIYATIHTFYVDTSGDLPTYVAAKEAHWSTSNHYVTMVVRGNMHPYEHGDLSWLRASIFVHDQAAMVWNSVESAIGDTQIICFKLARGWQPVPFRLSSMFTQTSFEAIPSIFWKGDLARFDIVNVYSLVGSLVLCFSHHAEVYLPRELLVQMLPVVQRKRTPESFGAFQASLRAYLRQKPDDSVAMNFSAVACVLWTLSLDQEESCLRGVVSHIPQIDRVNTLRLMRSPGYGALDFMRPYLFQIGCWWLAIFLSLIAFWFQVPFLAFFVLAVFGLMRLPLAFAAADSPIELTNFEALLREADGYGIFIAGVMFVGAFGLLMLREWRRYQIAREMNAIIPRDLVHVVQMNSCFDPEGFRTKKQLDSKATYHSTFEGKCEPKIAFVLFGPVAAACRVVVPRNCRHNMDLAMCNRTLFDLGSYKDTKTEDFWYQHMLAVLHSKTQVVDLVSISFDEWVSHFRPYRRTILEHANAVGADAKTLSKLFLKNEVLMTMYPWSSAFSGELVPRTIRASDVAFQIVCGPWIYSFSDWMHHHLDPCDAPVSGSFAYASGATLEDLGIWFDGCCSLGMIFFVRGDSHTFDRYVHCAELRATHHVFVDFGAPENVSLALKTRDFNHGLTTLGDYWSVDGTRNTGDNDTSCGNTLIQLAKAHALLDVAHVSDYRVIAMGDDLLIAFAFENQARSFAEKATALSAELGYNDDFQYCTMYTAEFCSKRPYPTLDGTVFGPKLGRFYARCCAKLATTAPSINNIVTWRREAAMCYAREAGFVPTVATFMTCLLGAPVSPDMHREEFEKRWHCAQAHVMNPALLDEFLIEAYDVTWDDIEDFNGYLSQTDFTPSLTAVAALDHPVLTAFLEADAQVKPPWPRGGL